MDILTFLAEIFASLSLIATSCIWPVTILILFVVLRKPLINLTSRLDISKLRYGKWEVEFSRRVQKLERQAEEANLGDLEEAQYEELFDLAQASPRAAVLEAWLNVEEALKRLAARADIGAQPPTSYYQLINALWKQEIIPNDIGWITKDLRQLRNIAAHELEFNPSPDQIAEYVTLALRIKNRLDSIEIPSE